MTDEQQVIIDKSDLRKYRTELPNLYDDAGLDPYQFRLLAHYVRVGNCYESVRTTARKCGMSPAQVCTKRKELAEVGFIVVTDNDYGTFNIEIVDKWTENFTKYSKPGVHHRNSRSPGKRKCSPPEQECSPPEPKKEPIKKEPIKKKNRDPAEVAVDNLVWYFSKITRIPPEIDHAARQKLWRNPLKRILMAKEGDEVMARRLLDCALTASERASQNGDTKYSISSPNSIIKFAMNIHRDGSDMGANGAVKLRF